jgi:hypothetical protein
VRHQKASTRRFIYAAFDGVLAIFMAAGFHWLFGPARLFFGIGFAFLALVELFRALSARRRDEGAVRW